jgi:hypothetical protein
MQAGFHPPTARRIPPPFHPADPAAFHPADPPALPARAHPHAESTRPSSRRNQPAVSLPRHSERSEESRGRAARTMWVSGPSS